MGRKVSNQTNKGQLLWIFRLTNSMIGQIDFHDDAALLTGVMLHMLFILILNRKIIIFLGILSEFNWSAYQVLLKMNHVTSFIQTVCSKYNTPTRNTAFNYNRLVTERY